MPLHDGNCSYICPYEHNLAGSKDAAHTYFFRSDQYMYVNCPIIVCGAMLKRGYQKLKWLKMELTIFLKRKLMSVEVLEIEQANSSNSVTVLIVNNSANKSFYSWWKSIISVYLSPVDFLGYWLSYYYLSHRLFCEPCKKFHVE